MLRSDSHRHPAVPPTDTPDPAARPMPARPWVTVALMAVAVLAYLFSVDSPFLFDDRPAIERNETIRQLWPLSVPLSPPIAGAGAAGRPITNLSLALNHALGGLDPGGYHAASIACHMLAVLALWGLLRRTLRRLRDPNTESIACGAALLWAVHPLASESVISVVQRNELLVALFYLLMLQAFARAAESPRPFGWQVAAFAACALGMASKEVMVSAPLAALFYDRTFLSGSFAAAWRQRWKLHLAFASTWLLLAWLMVRSEQRAGTVGFGLGMSPWHYLLTQGEALVIYLKLTLWPFPLVFDYGTRLAAGLREVWPQCLFVLGGLVATAIAVRRKSPAGFPGLVFFMVLAPSSSVVPLTTQPIAEHRMYLPLAALLVLLVAALHRLTLRPWRVIAAAAAVFCTLTVRRTFDYRSEALLWSATIAQRPDNARAHASLAGTLARDSRWAESLPHFETALRLQPDYADAHNDYALALTHVGRPRAALRHHEIAWRLKPGDPAIRSNLGLALTHAGQATVAIPHFEAAVAANPRSVSALNHLGDALLHAGRAEEALRRFESAIALEPDNFAAHNNAAVALGSLRRDAEAIGHFTAAARLEPGNFEVRVNFGDTLLRLGRATEAAAHYAAALALRPDVAELHYNLGNVRLELGQLDAAIASLTAAVQLRSDWAEARHNLALTLVRAGRATDAIPHYQQALRHLPGSAQIHHSLALALAATGQIAAAIAHDEAALRFQPGFTPARRHLDQLRMR